jgi:hypothetical protein
MAIKDGVEEALSTQLDSVTRKPATQDSTGGAAHTNQQGGTWDYGTWPQYQGLPVALSLPSAAAYTLANNVETYHWGELVITMGAGSTLKIEGRHADGTTVGILDAIGPAGTAVVLNATQLVPANNGRYRLNRFDVTDIIITKTGAVADTVVGRLASA